MISYSPFIVYDLETGGLDENKNPILELAFIVVLKDDKGDLYIDEGYSFESLVLPYNKDLIITSEALKVNKITMKELNEDGNDVENIKEVILDLVKELNPKNNERYRPILVGHNIQGFDNKFLEKFFENIGLPPLYNLFDKGCIDTYKIAKFLFEGKNLLSSLNLKSMCQYFGIEIKNHHRAYDDAMANAILFIKLNKMADVRRKEILEFIVKII